MNVTFNVSVNVAESVLASMYKIGIDISVIIPAPHRRLVFHIADTEIESLESELWAITRNREWPDGVFTISDGRCGYFCHERPYHKRRLWKSVNENRMTVSGGDKVDRNNWLMYAPTWK